MEAPASEREIDSAGWAVAKCAFIVVQTWSFQRPGAGELLRWGGLLGARVIPGGSQILAEMNTSELGRRARLTLAMGALGVVYGDIGTSPLYALRECFATNQALRPTHDNVLGVLSVIIWALILIVSVKYLMFVLRASNQGEGGVLALMGLTVPNREKPGRIGAVLVGMGLFGAGLIYGEGIITPSLTVLSAVEGVNVNAPGLQPFIVPVTVGILILLFSIQRFGTARVGGLFGPIMMVWFATLAVLGIRGILMAPEVLGAVNPYYALWFLGTSGWVGFVALGAVFLAVTGVEALYADMGHFGAGPIRIAWVSVVMPSLLLNYMGQGALLLQTPDAIDNPFYKLAPVWGQYPLVMLATVAAIIASQAMISGTYSLTMQAVQLGFLPRLVINHTSAHQRGQIYVPRANWMLMMACIALVVGFGSSTRLAAAYGIAVTMAMFTTSTLFFFATRWLWGWPVWKSAALVSLFMVIELVFCSANLLKVAHGGWVPLLLGAIVFTVMSTWRYGRRMLRQRLASVSLPLDGFLDDVARFKGAHVPGTAVFMAGNPNGVPLALLHNLKHNKVLHERNILLTIEIREVAHVDTFKELRVVGLRNGFHQVIGRYGFMDRPDVPQLLEACRAHGLEFEMMKTSFFLSSETIIPRQGHRWGGWREHLFAVLSRNAQRATAFFGLPPNRVVELGLQVEM